MSPLEGLFHSRSGRCALAICYNNNSYLRNVGAGRPLKSCKSRPNTACVSRPAPVDGDAPGLHHQRDVFALAC